jgi:hypothetical protein
MTSGTPEQQTCDIIDSQPAQCGWAVQNHSQMNISVALGVAIRKFSLSTGFAADLLYADGLPHYHLLPSK